MLAQRRFRTSLQAGASHLLTAEHLRRLPAEAIDRPPQSGMPAAMSTSMMACQILQLICCVGLLAAIERPNSQQRGFRTAVPRTASAMCTCATSGIQVMLTCLLSLHRNWQGTVEECPACFPASTRGRQCGCLQGLISKSKPGARMASCYRRVGTTMPLSMPWLLFRAPAAWPR